MKRRLSRYFWGSSDADGETPPKAPRKTSQRTCSNPDHRDTPAAIYCSECLCFFCKECEGHHSFMHSDHASSVCTDLSLESVFIGKCPSHPSDSLDYLCRTHNALCCDKCKLDKDGAHSKCDVVLIEKTMRDELPAIIASLQEKIRCVKVDKLGVLKRKQSSLEESVEAAKKNIKDTFDEIRRALNERENELLNDVDKAYNECNKAEMIMGIEGANEAESVLENLNRVTRSGVLKKLSDRNVVNCICEARKAMLELDRANELIDNGLEMASDICFECNNDILEGVKDFGSVPKREEFVFRWKECLSDVDEKRKYSVNKSNPMIVTKSNQGFYSTIIGDTPLPLNKVTSWSIKILKSRDNGNGIFIGVAPSDISQNEGDNYKKCGWYFYCFDSRLWSGPPHNCCGREYGLRKGNGQYVHTGDSVGVVIDTAKGELSFVLGGVDHGIAFKGIPIDEPLVPCILLFWKDDSVEILSSINLSNDGGCFIQ